MIIKNVFTKNAFGIRDLNINVSKGQILFFREDLDPNCEREFFYLCKALFDKDYYVNFIGQNGTIGYVVEVDNVPISLTLSRKGEEAFGSYDGYSLSGYKENIETTLLYNEHIDRDLILNLNDNFRDAIFYYKLRDYCFYEYDTLYCFLEVLYSALKEKADRPSRYPELEEETFKLFKNLLSQIKPIKLSKNVTMFYDKEGKRFYKNSYGVLLDELDSADEIFAELVDFYYTHKIIQEICKFREHDHLYPLFIRGALSRLKEEQIPYAITMLKDLETQIILCEEADFSDYKEQFDIYEVL